LPGKIQVSKNPGFKVKKFQGEKVSKFQGKVRTPEYQPIRLEP
jgi:hypothetical protein